MRNARALVPVLSLLLIALMMGFGLSIRVPAQQGQPSGEWRSWGGDLANTRYSPLAQIDGSNFNALDIAWRFKTDNLGPRPEFEFQSTPLMVNGTVYSTAGTRRAVVALDAGTGEMRWMYSLDEGARGDAAPRKLSGRGLAYWSEGREERIVFVTPGYQLIALNASTGRPVEAFGTHGIVDLKQEDDQIVDPVTGEIGLHATPVVAGNTIIVGAAHLTGGAPKTKRNEKGFVRGYDARTGRRLWIFHTIPSPGEFGNDTWENDSWSYTGNTGVWSQISVDAELGIVYIPVESATGDVYGGHRPGANLFSDSLVALDLKTGKRIWHYQLIHHDIWDRDIPCPPILADIIVDGRRIKAAIQPTKQAFTYVFDRVTGEPVWPIEERPVPKGDVPGEWYSPTQPFPTKPPPFDRQGITDDDLINFTPALHDEAVEIASRYKLGPIFTPPVVSRWEGPRGTLTVPETGGGANWQGGSFDPETQMFYIYSVTAVTSFGVVKSDGTRSDMDYIMGVARPPQDGQSGSVVPPSGGLSVQGLPLIAPPWGRITAIDMNKGEISWQIAHGDTPDTVKNHPALKGLTIPRTGRIGRLGTLVTKTLLIAGEGGYATTASGARGAMLRAYDKGTGKELGAVYMPAPQTGSPMTYMHNGRQYIVVAISGGTYSGELLAFRLPG